MDNIIGTVIVILSLLIIALSIYKPKIRSKKNVVYSFSQFIRLYMFGIVVDILLCLVIYYFYPSFEIVITIGVFLFACLTASILNNLFREFKTMKNDKKTKN